MPSNRERGAADWLAIALALVSLGGTLYIEATHNDRENAGRISALEQSRTDTTSRLDRIENKVDRLVDGLLKK